MLFYDINISLFGLNPLWHHFHLLVVVWLTSFATWLFLRLWVSRTIALLGSFLFIVGSPTLFISHEAMSGHYLYGLLFSILSMYYLVNAYRGKGYLNTTISAIFYLLALFCKEVFVPLPIVILFLPENTISKKLRHVSVHFILLFCYIIWRYIAFDGSFLGPRGVSINTLDSLEQIISIPILLFGNYWFVIITIISVIILYIRPIKLTGILFVVILLGAIFSPLIAVTSSSGIFAPDRYLYLPWWVLVCLFTFLSSKFHKVSYRFTLIFLLGLIFNQVFASTHWRQEIISEKMAWSKWYSYVLDKNEDNNLLILNNKGYYSKKWNIEGFRAAARRLEVQVNELGNVVSSIDHFNKLEINLPNKFIALDKKRTTLRAALNRQELEKWTKRLSPTVAENFVFKTLPKLGFSQAGFVDRIIMQGDKILVSGYLPTSTIKQSIITTSPVHCTAISYQYSKVSETAPKNKKNIAGIEFQLILSCPQIKENMLTDICIATRNIGEIFILDNSINQKCNRLTNH